MREQKTVWVKDPKIFPGGFVAGDNQYTDSWETRFRLAGNRHSMITVYAYGELPASEADRVEVDGVPRVNLSATIEFLICEDPSDPGGSEVWSDYRYIDHVLPGTFVPLNAEDLAKDLVTLLTAEDSFLLRWGWDGRSHGIPGT